MNTFFVYLSKKIATSNQSNLRCICWNKSPGWIACGGEGGILKVLQLDNESEVSKQKGVCAPGNILMNATLTGHKHTIIVADWNSIHGKLTSADEKGYIIVWSLHSTSNVWFEEMVNDREGNIYVCDLKWNHDGTKIAILYEDGAVIVGSVDGDSIWGSTFEEKYTSIAWSPDSKKMLFGNGKGSISVMDGSKGTLIHKIQLQFPPDYNLDPQVFGSLEEKMSDLAAIDWYNGSQGNTDEYTPCLAVSFRNGKIQLMKNEHDNRCIILNTGMRIETAKWNNNGTYLAVAGYGFAGNESNPEGSLKKAKICVQFYHANGHHARTMKITKGNVITGLAWEDSGLRIALSIDNQVFFANVRPVYQWGFFDNTLVYSYSKKTESQAHTVSFWSTKANEPTTKNILQLQKICAAGFFCSIISKKENEGSDLLNFEIMLCDSIGTPIETKKIRIEPIFVAMTENYVFIANESYVYTWDISAHSQKHMENVGIESKKQQQQQISSSFLTQSTDFSVSSSSRGFQQKNDEYTFFMQENFPANSVFKPTYHLDMDFSRESTDPITCINSKGNTLLIGRESGSIYAFSLKPQFTLSYKLSLAQSIKPSKIGINFMESMLCVIDTNNNFSVYDIKPNPLQQQLLSSPSNTGSSMSSMYNSKIIERIEKSDRKDVWDFIWSDEDEKTYAIMEKSKLLIFQGEESEEPIVNPGYLCEFKNLKVKTIFLDQILADPENMSHEWITSYETKALKQAVELFSSENLEQGLEFVKKNPHHKLWKLLGESALEKLNFNIAYMAFVNCKDYGSIQFVKRVKKIDDKQLQRAEIATFFKRFTEAEEIYLKLDRKDLIIELNKKIGNWFGVLQVLRETGNRGAQLTSQSSSSNLSGASGTLSNSSMNLMSEKNSISNPSGAGPNGSGVNDESLNVTWNQIGNYYFERAKWDKATRYYLKTMNNEKLIDCYYHLERYEDLEHLISLIPDTSSHLLMRIGEKLASVGLCDAAVKAFLKAGNVLQAINTCVELNSWDLAISLSKDQQKYKEIKGLLFNYAEQFVSKNRIPEAIELYQKANRHADAARLLAFLGQKAAKELKQPLKAKMLHVQAALEIELLKKKTIEAKMLKGENRDRDGKLTSSKILNELLKIETTTGFDKALENHWRGAEAYHFYILCLKLLHKEEVDEAVTVACRLREYEDVLDPTEIHSLLALCAYYSGNMKLCSSAFVKLEGLRKKDVSFQTPQAPKSIPFVDLNNMSMNSSIGDGDRLLKEITEKKDSSVGEEEDEDEINFGNDNNDQNDEETGNPYEELAISLFAKLHNEQENEGIVQLEDKMRPVDECPSCKTPCFEHQSFCHNCQTTFYPCIVTGKSIFHSSDWVCNVCKHRCIAEEVYGFQYCPLCHTKVIGNSTEADL